MRYVSSKFRLVMIAALALSGGARSQTLKHSVTDVTNAFLRGAEFDLDQDGFGDVLHGTSVYSGFDGSPLLGPLCGGCLGDVDVLGDVDGDGVTDFVYANMGAGLTGTEIRALSGADGSVISYVAVPDGIGNDAVTAARGVGDADGDGVPDAVVATTGLLGGLFGGAIFVSGSTWTPDHFVPDTDTTVVYPLGDLTGDGANEFAIYTPTTLTSTVHTVAGGSVVALFDLPSLSGFEDFGDRDGDGLDDILAVDSANAETVVLSGDDLSPLLVIGESGNAAAPGDLDCDGFADVLTSKFLGPTTLFSGQDGSILWTVPSWGAVQAIGDIDADGVRDFGITSGSFNALAELWSSPVPDPTTIYCTGKVTTAGCTPSIGSAGFPSLLGDDDFHLQTTLSLAAKPGLFFWGTSGPTAVPFLGGTLCVQPPLRRGPVLLSQGPADCMAGYDFFFSKAYALASGVEGGDTINGQFWMRDPAQADGTGVTLSNAIEFTWCD